jgi:hypothetical protein
MGFGMLRVLNDDVVTPNNGFSTHHHENMEIVSIPLSGSLRHQDSEGNETIIKKGEVQLMSAGTGVYHSEFNNSDQDMVNFLQIWVFPERIGITPRYEQLEFPESGRQNEFQLVVSPWDEKDPGIKINQQAYFSLLNLDAGRKVSYNFHDSKHGVYLFVISGTLNVSGDTLTSRDAIGIHDTDAVEISAENDSQLLAIEVGMSS